MNKSESIAKISSALLMAQGEMGNAVKGASNPFFKSKFADLNSIREASLPVLNKHGIVVLQPMTVVNDKNFIETTLLHESGEFLSSLTEIVVAKINDPQAQGSGQSYARRYGLQSFLCIGAEDDDGEKAMDRTKFSAKDVPIKSENKPSPSVVAPVTSIPHGHETGSIGVVVNTTTASGNSVIATKPRPSFRKSAPTSVAVDPDDI